MDGNVTTSNSVYTDRALTSLEHTSNPVVIVIDEEQDRNRNFSANIFVVPCGEPTLNSGTISLNGGDVGSLVLEVDDSDPESSCTCTIECWVHETDAQNRPKTKVNLCPRCSERAKKRHSTTLSLSVSRNGTGIESSEASTSASSLARENILTNVDNQKRLNNMDIFENHQRIRDVTASSQLRTKMLQKRRQSMRCVSLGKFKCFKCRKLLPTSDRLRKHTKQHEESKHYPCPQCLRVFKTRCSTALHILREHKV